jgi:hypothetical protein
MDAAQRLTGFLAGGGHAWQLGQRGKRVSRVRHGSTGYCVLS